MIPDDKLNEALRLYGRATNLTMLDRIGQWDEVGLTIPQLRVLFLLRREPGAAAGAIARHLKVTPSTVTGLIDRLVRIGLVRRTGDASDRRVVRNVLTERGLAVVSDLGREGQTRLMEAFRSMEPRRFEGLLASLASLVPAAGEAESTPATSG